MGEHEVTNVFLHLVPLVVPMVFLGLGLFTVFLQTFIFVTLSIIYLALAVEHH
jgi:F-type H+-transporting ATPase subunit a